MDHLNGVLGNFYLARYTDWGVAGVWLGLIIGLSIACVLLLSRLYLNTKRLSQT